MHFVGKRGGNRESARQDDITALLIHLARENLRVLRLKGGDPYIFGRGGEEALSLARAQHPVPHPARRHLGFRRARQCRHPGDHARLQQGDHSGDRPRGRHR